MSDAHKLMERIEALANISEEPHQLTRTFASQAMRQANELVGSWMRGAGMEIRIDAAGNLIGRYSGKTTDVKTLLIGSHLDTVCNAGKFDGSLGVLLGIACVEALQKTNERLPFAIEVIGFSDEEGVRYQTTYLGSRALTGDLSAEDLKRIDANGITMADALRKFGTDPTNLADAKGNPDSLLGYIEAHIEQGPVLENENLAVGVVTGIAGQSRIKVRFTGRAGHAGTTPMSLREDALCAAAVFILAVETHASRVEGLVGTVGRIENTPNASNVIPGEVTLTLDVRHQDDDTRIAAVKFLQQCAEKIATTRKVSVDWQSVQETKSVACSTKLTEALRSSVEKHQGDSIELSSGAGHDAAVMARITPSAMLFIRCKGGISHHPDESATTEDIAVALNVMNDFLQSLAQQHA